MPVKIIDLTQPLSLSHLHDMLHSGTHVDAPAYLIPNGKTIDRFAPEFFLKDAVLLDLTNAGAGEQIEDEDLEAAEEEAGLAVRQGEAVILHTGWSKTEHGDQYPFLSQNGAEYLEFKRTGIVGVDTPNVDGSRNMDSPAHSVLLRSEILVLEGLCNLNLVEVERFRLIALPLKANGPCSPVRAVALVD
jgi:arylformamidase